MKTVLFITLAIIQVIIVLIPILGKLASEKSNTSTYKITTWGKALLIFTISGLLLTVMLFLFSESDESDNRTKLTNGINAGVDSSRKLLFKDLSDALAKQDLRYDSAQKRIEKLVKDSSNKVNNFIQPQPEPQVSICMSDSSIKVVQKMQDEIIFSLRVCGYNSTAKKVKSVAYVIGAKNGQYRLLKKVAILSNETLLSFEDNVVFIPTKGTDGINVFFFYVEHQFETELGKKMKNEDVGQITLSTNISGKANAEFRNQIMNFLKK